jgi:hypothetical protein
MVLSNVEGLTTLSMVEGESSIFPIIHKKSSPAFAGKLFE